MLSVQTKLTAANKLLFDDDMSKRAHRRDNIPTAGEAHVCGVVFSMAYYCIHEGPIF